MSDDKIDKIHQIESLIQLRDKLFEELLEAYRATLKKVDIKGYRKINKK